jgi:O-antigen ligase
LFFLYSVVVSLLSIAIWPFFPDLALQPVSSTGAPELRGIIDHQLRLGMLLCLAIGLVLLAVANDDLQVVRGRWLKALLWGGILLCIAVLVLSRARGSTAAFAVALMVCGTLARQRWIMLASIAALAATILAIVLFGDQIAAATLQSASDKTLSGRTILWPKAIDLADQRPWFGYGFASFYTPIFEPYWKYYTPPSAHNTFIQAYFETGAIGAAFMFVLIITFIVSGLQISLILGRISYTLFAALFVTFTGLVDTVLAGKLTILVTVLLLIAAQEASELRRAIRGSLT